MPWATSKRTNLAELLQKLALLYSKVIELQIKQKCARAEQQIKMANTPANVLRKIR